MPFSVLRKFALSIADCSSLPTVAATRFFVNNSVLRASSTRWPLIRSSTRRAFCGETRMYRASLEIPCSRLSFMPSAPRALPLPAAGARRPPGTPAGRAAASVAAFIECPLKVRVKLNSPSLWPTMFSVMYTGMNFLPLCTAIVWPTISGITVERRDQVRSTFFSLRAFMPSTLACRWLSMNGPFLVERAINSALSFQLSAFSKPGLRRCRSPAG